MNPSPSRAQNMPLGSNGQHVNHVQRVAFVHPFQMPINHVEKNQPHHPLQTNQHIPNSLQQNLPNGPLMKNIGIPGNVYNPNKNLITFGFPQCHSQVLKNPNIINNVPNPTSTNTNQQSTPNKTINKQNNLSSIHRAPTGTDNKNKFPIEAVSNFQPCYQNITVTKPIQLKKQISPKMARPPLSPKYNGAGIINTKNNVQPFSAENSNKPQQIKQIQQQKKISSTKCPDFFSKDKKEAQPKEQEKQIQAEVSQLALSAQTIVSALSSSSINQNICKCGGIATHRYQRNPTLSPKYKHFVKSKNEEAKKQKEKQCGFCCSTCGINKMIEGCELFPLPKNAKSIISTNDNNQQKTPKKMILIKLAEHTNASNNINEPTIEFSNLSQNQIGLSRTSQNISIVLAANPRDRGLQKYKCQSGLNYKNMKKQLKQHYQKIKYALKCSIEKDLQEIQLRQKQTQLNGVLADNYQNINIRQQQQSTLMISQLEYGIMGREQLYRPQTYSIFANLRGGSQRYSLSARQSDLSDYHNASEKPTCVSKIIQQLETEGIENKLTMSPQIQDYGNKNNHKNVLFSFEAKY